MRRISLSYLVFSSLIGLTTLLSATPSSWNTYKKSTLQNLSRFPGWCNKEKAEILMDFVYETKPTICVEIGAFGGSTTYPIASSLRFINQGKLYAIDAWDNQAAIEGLEKGDPNLEWWKKVDMRAIKNQFISSITSKKLTKWCQPISNRSEQAVLSFADESIDFLYIDGNCSSSGSFRDVFLFFPKVKTGGFIWFNDADADSKNKSVAFLMQNCSWIREWSIQNRCIVFRK
jgi:Methyltransferase domain